MNVPINLTYAQIHMVAVAGVIRQIQYVKRGGKETHGLKKGDQNWNTKIEGALSEYALAKYLDLHWEGAGEVGGNDVGNEEVRVTDNPNGSLIVRSVDKDEKRYWLLTGRDGSYIIRGYMYARDAKQEKYLSDKGTGREPAYFVPQSDLKGVRE